MLALNDCFKTYYNLGGVLSLEDVFFGKVRKSVGNKAARSLKIKKFVKLAIALEMKHEDETQLDVAEKLIKELGLFDDPTSLLRQYRRKIAKLKK